MIERRLLDNKSTFLHPDLYLALMLSLNYVSTVTLAGLIRYIYRHKINELNKIQINKISIIYILMH